MERNPYVNAGDGYSWFIVERNPVPSDLQKHNLSRDSEVAQISTLEGLGYESVLAPMTIQEVNEVARLPHVRRISLGGSCSIIPNPNPEPPQVRLQGIQALQMHRVPELWAKGLTGRGVKVAVIDTGLDEAQIQPFFAGRTTQLSFIEGEDWRDGNGHGTFICGQVGASGGDYGVAPDAQLMVIKGLANSGSGSYSTLIQSIDWAIRSGAQVISASWGGPGDASSPVSQAMDAAFARGVLPLVAAGNEQSGRTEYMADQTAPAASLDAITVGACDTAFNIAAFSNIGKALDIAAIGVQVRGLGLNGAKDVYMSGTSMATPHVAGAAALLMQTGKTAAEVRKALYAGARDTGLAIVQEGNGILDALAAYEQLAGQEKPPAPPPGVEDVVKMSRWKFCLTPPGSLVNEIDLVYKNKIFGRFSKRR